MTQIPEDEHKRVLATGEDVPDKAPSFAIGLTEVGITNKTLWPLIGVTDPIRAPFTASLTVDLGPERRGIHMSRMEQAVSDLHEKHFENLTAYGMDLCALVLDGQQATRAVVHLKGILPMLGTTPISKKKSVDNVQISCTVTMTRKTREITVGAGINHLTACPCTQVYNRELFHIEDTSLPLATHSQRSITTVAVTVDADTMPPLHDTLINCLTTALHPARDLLKRPDEAELVIAAHRRPQFAEDAVRETARAVADSLAGVLAPESKVTIESLSLESIHIHDVLCRLETTFAEIRKKGGNHG